MRECVPKTKCWLVSVWFTGDPEHLTLVINLCVSHINEVAFLWFHISFVVALHLSDRDQGCQRDPWHPLSRTHDQKVWKQAGVWSNKQSATVSQVDDHLCMGKRYPHWMHRCLFCVSFTKKTPKKSHMKNTWLWGKTPGVNALWGAARWAEGSLSA